MRDTFYDIIENIESARNLISKRPDSRENSLAITKLDEAKMWFKKGDKEYGFLS